MGARARKALDLAALLAAAVVSVLVAPAALAQDYPNKNVRIVAPSTPGGGFDLVARVLGNKLSEQMGQQFVVENRSGGGTLLGTQTVARAPADGYNLLVGGLSNMALNMGLYKQPGYDPLTDFVPLRIVVSHSYTLIGRKDLPVSSLNEVLTYARANPGKLTIGSSGPGSGQFILGSLLRALGKVDILQVPYKGAQPVYQDLLAGRVDLFFDNTTTARPYIDSGQAKALAVSSRQRAPDGMTVPTLMETGVMNLEMETWFGLFAPAKTPRAIVQKISRDVGEILRLPESRALLLQQGAEASPSTPEAFEKFVRSEIVKWSKVIKAAGIQPI